MKKEPSNGWKERKITKERDTYFKCGKKGHKAIECGKFQCYNCGKQGHLVRDCKVRPRSNQKKKDIVKKIKMKEQKRSSKKQEDFETKKQRKEEALQRVTKNAHEQNRESVVNERILKRIKENMKKNGIKKKRNEMNEIKLKQ